MVDKSQLCSGELRIRMEYGVLRDVRHCGTSLLVTYYDMLRQNALTSFLLSVSIMPEGTADTDPPEAALPNVAAAVAEAGAAASTASSIPFI